VRVEIPRVVNTELSRLAEEAGYNSKLDLIRELLARAVGFGATGLVVEAVPHRLLVEGRKGNDFAISLCRVHFTERYGYLTPRELIYVRRARELALTFGMEAAEAYLIKHRFKVTRIP
jgi:hypothetical protein